MKRMSITGIGISTFRYCSMPVSFFHFAFIKVGILNWVPEVAIKDVHYSQIKYHWEIKFIRRLVSVLVRSPFRAGVLNLVNPNINFPEDGCVILTCHTPWKRLLVQWCLHRQFALIIAQGQWKNNRGMIQCECRGISEIRKLVLYLKNKGNVIFALDVFNHKNDCPVEFRNKECNASTVPVRLALLAGVPLITVFPVYSNGLIQFVEGSGMNTGVNPNPSLVIQEMIGELKSLMQKHPVICS